MIHINEIRKIKDYEDFIRITKVDTLVRKSLKEVVLTGISLSEMKIFRNLAFLISMASPWVNEVTLPSAKEWFNKREFYRFL